MSDIQHRTVESTKYWWECPRCGYHTHTYAGPATPAYHKEKHEPVCARAAELGLAPFFDNSSFYTYNTKIRGWKRESDGACLEIHMGCKRNVWVPCETLEEALRVGYQQHEWEDEKIRCTKRVVHRYTEARFVLDDNWQNPIEIYEVPDGWSWRDHDAEIPWISNKDEEE